MTDKIDSKFKAPRDVRKQIKLCNRFYKRVIGKDKKFRIQELRRTSKIKYGCHISYLERRKKKYTVVNERCFCCGGEAVCKHHIILIGNGGYDIEQNRISICDHCHAEIHDFLVINIEEENELDRRYRNTIY